MTATTTSLAPPQRLPLVIAVALAAAAVIAIAGDRPKQALLFIIGTGLGVALFHSTFGFTGAYRRAVVHKDLTGVLAQAAMLLLATALFAPLLASGQANGAVAPISVAMLTGAFVFGVGMQLGGGCASGTLFTAGGGNVRMGVVLIFFCAGSWLATLNMEWWRALPNFGAVSLGKRIGFLEAFFVQAAMLGLIVGVLYLWGARKNQALWGAVTWRTALRGPWPLLAGGIALALLNWATLATAGHPWGITWGFTVWGAKAAALLGWDPATSAYWSVPWRAGALEQPILANTTSVMNIGIILGALAAAALAAKVRPSPRIPWRSLAAAIVGGLMMGYGARLAYGCNIGALFSGVASTSLHGWAWIGAAILGNMIGIRLRPRFGLSNG